MKQLAIPDSQILSLDTLFQFVSRSSDFFYITDFKHDIKWVNLSFLKAYGYSLDDLLGQKITDLIDALSADTYIKKIETALQTLQENVVLEASLQHKDGSQYWADWTLIPDHNKQLIYAIGRDVQSRKAVEATLRHSQEFLYKVLDLAPDIVFVYNIAEERTIYANQEIFHVLGYTPAEFEDDERGLLSQLMHPDDYKDLPGYHARLATLNDTDILTRDYRIKNAQGTWSRLYSREMVFRRDAQGRVTEVLGFAEDVTLHTEAANALQKSEHQYMQLVDLMSEGLLIRDESGMIVYLSSQLSKMLGYEIQEVIGHSEREFIAESYLPILEEQSRLRAKGQRSTYEINLLHKDGHLINALIVATPIFSDEGVYQGSLSIITDISELTQTKNQLRSSEARFQAFMESSPAATFIKDDEGRYLYVNASYIEALNYQHVEWFGKTDFELWDTETASQFYANDQRVLSSDQALVTEEVTRQENHVQTWMMYKFPFHDSSGKRYLAGMAMDITEQRRLEQQGIELTVERERVHLITQFIQNASHEFRTPLTLIQYAAYWLENLEDGERRRREVEKIKLQANVILSLVDTLITMATLDSGLDIEHGRVNMREVIEHVAEDFALTVREKQLDLTLQFMSETLEVQGDIRWLGRAFKELVDNAIRYTPKEGSVSIVVHQVPKQLLISITDSGIGIDPMEHKRIFERFFRMDRAHTTRGFGMGLSIAKRIFELHHGNIGVISAIGMGTTFTVTLPLTQP